MIFKPVPYRELEYTAIYSQLKIRITVQSQLQYHKISTVIMIISYYGQLFVNDMQNSRTTGDIIYADLGPNAAVKAAHQQNLTLLDDDRVQYEEIRHEAGPSVFEPSTADKVLGKQLDKFLVW